MGDRLTKAAADLGAGREGVAYILQAYAGAMRLREGRGLSDEDPDFLHPGRTVLILLEDVAEIDPRVLAVGALTESRRDELRLDSERVERLLAPSQVRMRSTLGDLSEGTQWWRALPPLGWGDVSSEAHDRERLRDERRLEDLVTAPPPVQRIALAEALDQIRHAHLWSSLEDRRRAVAIARRVMHPLATRVDDVLARRYDWWLRRVGPALEQPAPEAPRGRAPSGA
jgi:hypothetical protein